MSIAVYGEVSVTTENNFNCRDKRGTNGTSYATELKIECNWAGKFVGVWHGACCDIKFLHLSSPISEVLSGIEMLLAQSHPFILQYYLARALHITSDPRCIVAGGTPATVPAMFSIADLTSAPYSIGIESIIGSSFLNIINEDHHFLDETEAVVAVVRSIQPRLGDLIVALITESCSLVSK